MRGKTGRTVAAVAAALAVATVAVAQDEEAPKNASGGDIVGYGEIHSPVIGRGGMVSSQSAIATRVGTAILRAGGNAVDAAVATALAEAVALPRAGNLGGGGYMLVHMAARRGKPAQDIAINYYGVSPHAITPNLLLGPDGKIDHAKEMTFAGVAVPGTVAGLWEAHHRFGRLSWAKVVNPAIGLAGEGILLSEGEAEATAGRRTVLMRDPGARAAFLKPDGSAYRPGERFRQPDLAWTLTRVRDGGPTAFYKGEVARRLVAGIHAGGGIIDMADLAAFRPEVSGPIWSSYRGLKIAYMPPTSAGVTLAEAMNLIEHFPMQRYRWGSVDSLHVIAEAMKIANADRRLVGGAPQWHTPGTGLASKAFADERVKLIRMDRSLDGKAVPDGNPYPFESKNTTHLVVADAEGDAVSNTFTLSASYGAHVVAPGTGFLLNNSLGNFAWGRQDANAKANAPEPGKRLGSTITPLMVFKNDAPWLVTGTPGGGYIVATMAQMLVNVIDFGLNVAEAAERPRINQGWGDAPLELEDGFSPDIVPLLEARGHKVKPSLTMGSTQSIMVDHGRFLGAADTRRPDALAEGVQ